MIRIILEALAFTALLLVFTIPLTLVGRYRNRTKHLPKWWMGAGIFGTIVSLLAWSSRRLVESCEQFNDDCVDIGSAGFRFIIIAGFCGWALLSAYMRYNDY